MCPSFSDHYTSSVYKSNKNFLNQFANSERFDAEQEVILATKTIDILADENELHNIDFAKIIRQL